MLAAPRGFEPRFTDPKSAVLPLDEGAVPRPGQRKWSGRRDSNPRPSPWQGDALPTEPLPLDADAGDGAESQIRTGDTAIFSRVLYQLSYLGPVKTPARARRRGAEYHARRSGGKERHPVRRAPPGQEGRFHPGGAGGSAGAPAPPSSAAAMRGSRTWSGLETAGWPLSCRSRLIRSSAGGWVENRLDDCPVAALI